MSPPWVDADGETIVPPGHGATEYGYIFFVEEVVHRELHGYPRLLPLEPFLQRYIIHIVSAELVPLGVHLVA